MDLLNELVFILAKSGKLDDVSAKLPPNDDSKSRILFDAIVNERVCCDEEAAHLIYNSSPKDKKYLMLKRNLANKLSQAIHETSYAELEEDNYVAIAFECRAQQSVAERLLKQNVFHNAERIIKRMLETARENQLNEIELDGLKQLRTIYSLSGDVKKLCATTEKIDFLYQQIGQQTKAEGFLQLIRAKLLFSISCCADVEQIAEQALQEIRGWQKSNGNIFLERYALQIDMLRARVAEHPKAYERKILAYETFLNENPGLKIRQSNLLLTLEHIRCYLSAANFEKAFTYIQRGLELSDYRSFDRFDVQSLHFDYCLKTKQYLRAGNVLAEVHAQPQVEFLYPPDKAAWSIRRAFLYYALLNTKGEAEIKQYTPSFMDKAALQRFLQDGKGTQKDKQGYHLAYLIISLFLAAERDLSRIDYEAASMKTYFHRHLKGMRDGRSKLFFKWCYQLASKNFQHKEPDVLNQLFQQLKTVEGSPVGGCEFIPYEELGSWVVARYCKCIAY